MSDTTLIQQGKAMCQFIDAAYPLYKKAERIRGPFERKRAPLLRGYMAGGSDSEASRKRFMKAWDDWKRTPTYERWMVEWEAFIAASNGASKVARWILCRKPETVTGFAYYALAVAWEDGVQVTARPVANCFCTS